MLDPIRRCRLIAAVLTAASLVVVSPAFAQAPAQSQGGSGHTGAKISIGSLITIGLLLFGGFLAKTILAEVPEDKRKKARQLAIMAGVAMFLAGTFIVSSLGHSSGFNW